MCSAFVDHLNLYHAWSLCCGIEPWTGTDTRRPINIYGLNFQDTDECIFQWTRRFERLSSAAPVMVIGSHWWSYHVISCHMSKSKQHSQQMSILKAYSEPSSCHYPSSCPILCSLVPGQLQWCSLNVCLSTALSSAFCDPRKTSAKTIGHRFLIRKSASFCINLEIALNPSILKNSRKTFWWYPVTEATSRLRTSNAALQVTLRLRVISCGMMVCNWFPPSCPSCCSFLKASKH